MKLEKETKWGYFVCPKCGLPLLPNRTVYKCNSIWGSGIKGCGYTIKKSEVEC